MGVYGQSVNRRLSIPLGKHATVFQAKVYAILACVEETATQDRPEKHVSICSSGCQNNVSVGTIMPAGIG